MATGADAGCGFWSGSGMRPLERMWDARMRPPEWMRDAGIGVDVVDAAEAGGYWDRHGYWSGCRDAAIMNLNSKIYQYFLIHRFSFQ